MDKTTTDPIAVPTPYPYAHNVYGEQAQSRAAELADQHPDARIYIFPLRGDVFAAVAYKGDHSVVTSVCCPPEHLDAAMLIAAREVPHSPPMHAQGE